MPRALRIEYNGAYYHVMNRGINRMKIFLNENHINIFLTLLEEISILFGIKIHSYCLMDNHYHLLLETPHANLGKAMRHLNGLYTQRFNRLENRDGALFRGRYKAILIEAENYLLQVSRYIHLNPLEANIVKDPNDYAWSSCRYYTTTEAPYWLSSSYILNHFDSKEGYVEFLNEGINDALKNFYNPAIRSILGNKKFLNANINMLDEKYKIVTSVDINHTIKTYAIEEVCRAVTYYFNIEIENLKQTYKNNFPRMLAIYLVRNLTRLNHQKISDFFTGLQRASISTTVAKCKRLIKEKTIFKNIIKI
jgi:putative transposase